MAITELGLSVTQLGLPVAHGGRRVTLLGGLGAVIGRQLAIARGLDSIRRRLGPRQGRQGAIGRGMLTIGHCMHALVGRTQLHLPVGGDRRDVMGVGLSVTQLRRHVPLLLRLDAIGRHDLPVAAGLRAVRRGLGPRRGRHGAFGRRMLALAHAPQLHLTVRGHRGNVMGFGLSVAQLSGNVTLLCRLGAGARDELSLAGCLAAVGGGLET